MILRFSKRLFERKHFCSPTVLRHYTYKNILKLNERGLLQDVFPPSKYVTLYFYIIKLSCLKYFILVLNYSNYWILPSVYMLDLIPQPRAYT